MISLNIGLADDGKSMTVALLICVPSADSTSGKDTVLVWLTGAAVYMFSFSAMPPTCTSMPAILELRIPLFLFLTITFRPATTRCMAALSSSVPICAGFTVYTKSNTG